MVLSIAGGQSYFGLKRHQITESTDTTMAFPY